MHVRSGLDVDFIRLQVAFFHHRVCLRTQELKVLQEKDTVDREKAVGVAVKAAKKLKKKGGKKKKKK